MAFPAFILELAAVLILVAIIAGWCQAKEGAVLLLFTLLLNVFGNDVSGVVALVTLEAVVLPFEFKAGLLMVEFVWIPSDEIKLSPVVLLMAFRTLQLPGIVMVPVFIFNAGLNLLVALQAIVAECLLAKVVAFCATPHPFQLFMDRR